MKHVDLKPVGKFLGRVGEIALYGLSLAASWKFSEYMTATPERKPAEYDDAVSAILKSNMYSHDKCTAAGVLKRGENAVYYQSIVHIAKDPEAYSHDKVSMIKRMSEN